MIGAKKRLRSGGDVVGKAGRRCSARRATEHSAASSVGSPGRRLDQGRLPMRPIFPPHVPAKAVHLPDVTTRMGGGPELRPRPSQAELSTRPGHRAEGLLCPKSPIVRSLVSSYSTSQHRATRVVAVTGLSNAGDFFSLVSGRHPSIEPGGRGPGRRWDPALLRNRAVPLSRGADGGATFGSLSGGKNSPCQLEMNLYLPRNRSGTPPSRPHHLGRCRISKRRALGTVAADRRMNQPAPSPDERWGREKISRGHRASPGPNRCSSAL